MNESLEAPSSISVEPGAPAPFGDRIPVLDALRGIAILLVMLVHFTPDYRMPNRLLEWIKKAALSGWTGVDLFFVLSGFLITGILLRTKASPHYFRDFYGRRALRILPLYLGTLALVFLAAPPPPTGLLGGAGVCAHANDARLALAALRQRRRLVAWI